MKIYIVYFAICFSFYIMGAYATTDILRLVKGATSPVNAPNCYCPICNYKIPLCDQLPIISYVSNHGFCRKCKSKIPFSELFLELFLFSSFSTITIFLHFNWLAYFLCIILFEGTKFFFILKLGKRETAFLKNLTISLFNNFFLFCLLGILFALTKLT